MKINGLKVEEDEKLDKKMKSYRVKVKEDEKLNDDDIDCYKGFWNSPLEKT